MLLAGDVQKFPQALGLENLGRFLRISKHLDHVSHPYGRMEMIRDIYNLNLFAKLMVFLHQIAINIHIAEANTDVDFS